MKFLSAALVSLGLAAALSLASASAAEAHVRVDPTTVTPGGYAVLTFRVPTESASASTVRLEVDFPTATPFSTVSYEPVAGWKTRVVTSKLATPVKTAQATITEAVTKVIWSADPAAAIKPGQFQRFTVSAGPVPDAGTILLPAHQTYSDGTVVDWAQPTPASGVEPEHPAPTLTVSSAAAALADPANDPGAEVGNPAPTARDTAAAPAQGTGVAAFALGLGGIVLGAISLGVALAAYARGRTPSGQA